MAKLYTNENVPLPVAEELRRLGHDVMTVQESGLGGQSVPDHLLLTFAIDQGRGLITLNRSNTPNSSGRLLSIVHEAVPFVESCPDSRAVRAFHGGRAGAVRDQAAAIWLAFGPIGL